MTIYFSEADDNLYNLIDGQEVNYHWQNYAFLFKKELLNDNKNIFGISIVPTLEYWRHSSGSKDSKSIYNQQDSQDGNDKFDNFIGSISLPISNKLSENFTTLIVPGITFLPEKLGSKGIGKKGSISVIKEADFFKGSYFFSLLEGAILVLEPSFTFTFSK